MKKSIVLAAIVLLVGCQKSESKQSLNEIISADSHQSKTQDIQANSAPMTEAEKKETTPNPNYPLSIFAPSR